MFKKKEHKLWLYVGGTMIVVILVWAFIFYPQSLRFSQKKVSSQFVNFQSQITQALSAFKNKVPINNTINSVPAEDVQDLRQRVFGDSVKRP